jgi:predicted nucleotidyltransferase
MNQELTDKIKSVAISHPEIKLVYLFGSRASGETGPLSDYDIAIYVDVKDRKKLFDLRLVFMDEVSRALMTDMIDVVILNLAESPELKYHIIKDGKMIYAVEPFNVLIEPKILNEYFDFRDILQRHKLTNA